MMDELANKFKPLREKVLFNVPVSKFTQGNQYITVPQIKPLLRDLLAAPWTSAPHSRKD
jgi:hypothetical protein